MTVCIFVLGSVTWFLLRKQVNSPPFPWENIKWYWLLNNWPRKLKIALTLDPWQSLWYVNQCYYQKQDIINFVNHIKTTSSYLFRFKEFLASLVKKDVADSGSTGKWRHSVSICWFVRELVWILMTLTELRDVLHFCEMLSRVVFVMLNLLLEISRCMLVSLFFNQLQNVLKPR